MLTRSNSARLIAARTMLSWQDILLDTLLSAARTPVIIFLYHLGSITSMLCGSRITYAWHMGNRLATVTTKDIDMVVKIFGWVLFNDLIAVYETVVIVNVNPKCRGICVDLG